MPDADFGAPLMQRFADFAQYTDVPGELTRLYLSPAHKRAADALAEWMQAAGMRVRMDALATVIGRYEATVPDAPALLIGSHIDTVRNGGRYDGTLGVFAAVAAVEELRRLGERFPFAIEVVAFGDEEGVRFPVTLCGSKALAGTLDATTLDVADADGISLRQALRDFGCDPDRIDDARRSPDATLAFIEAHIEQGPVLEQADQPLGVVTAISAAKRFRITVTGAAEHAGTVPMSMRRDSLAASAEMVLAVEDLARRADNVVATVGFIEAEPGAVNVIPGATRFSVDLRSSADAVCTERAEVLEATFNDIATRRGVSVTIETTHAMPAAACAESIRRDLAHAIQSLGHDSIALPSGAGHDAMAMVPLCDTGMLFLRCKDGLSHHPDESITAADADACVRALLNFIRGFDPAPAR